MGEVLIYLQMVTFMLELTFEENLRVRELINGKTEVFIMGISKME